MPPEWRNLADYARTLYRHGAVVAGSFGLAAAFWGLDKWSPAWWRTPPSWLSPLLVGAGIVIAKYLAWREAWLARGTPARPFLPRGLRLETQTPSLVERSATPARTTFKLEAAQDLRGKVIRISCDGPIYGAHFTALAGLHVYDDGDVRHDDTHSVIFDFRSERLAQGAFMAIFGEVDSVAPIRVTRVEWISGNTAYLTRHRRRQ